MNNEILFTEKQTFKQWWLWLILLSINALFVVGVFVQITGNKQFGTNPMSNAELLTATIITFLITILFLIFKLETIIKNDGIYVRFFPFHIKFKYYSWNSLTKLYVRHYSPLREYGGWGLRMGIFGSGKAYNISGNKGLQLEFTNKSKLLIGTKQPEQITETLKKIDQIKSIFNN